jgi:hypothetical protein
MEMSAPQPEEPPKEKTTNEDNKFEGQAKESEQEDVRIGENQRLQLLPENEEEETYLTKWDARPT